jgi:hypothetical protein
MYIDLGLLPAVIQGAEPNLQDLLEILGLGAAWDQEQELEGMQGGDSDEELVTDDEGASSEEESEAEEGDGGGDGAGPGAGGGGGQ